MIDLGWQAHFADDSFLMRHVRLYLYRDIPHGEVEIANGDGTVTRHDAMVVPDVEGIILPAGAREAIIASLDPPAHKAEIRRLEEALAVERKRVDDLLARRL